MNSISNQIKQLLKAQKNEWELAGKNFAGLEKVQVQVFEFDGFKIKVQFNPGRIVSSAAKVDKKSIEARPCFLCKANRPGEQRGVGYGDYTLLVNPFPIFTEHYTVPTFAHTPQRIKGNFKSMLDLAEVMEGYTLFYNGPRCGASAPDHFHFQAGNNCFMPIGEEIEFLKEKYGTNIGSGRVRCFAVQDGVRNFLVLESCMKSSLCDKFDEIYRVMEEFSEAEEEPMMNVLASCDKGNWRILIFPRALHRPWQYTAEGDKNILLSPASVDMGGVLITPLEKDFKKISKKDIVDILGQVLLDDEKFEKLVENIVNQ